MKNKLLIIILGLLSILGCSKKPTNDPLVEGLISRNFFNYAEVKKTPEEWSSLMANDCIISTPHSRRFYPVDAEILAESGVVDFLKEIEPFLSIQNINLSGLSQGMRDNDETYWVKVNGKEYVIYRSDEYRNQRLSIWGISTVRTFELINHLLKEANSVERIYALYGGNDLSSVFLTSSQYNFIVKESGIKKIDMPYIPKLESPWYGQQHNVILEISKINPNKKQIEFLRNVEGFNEKYNAITMNNKIINLRFPFWDFDRIEGSKNIKKEWEVDECHIPFYGDWHDLFCLDLKTNKVLYLDDDRNVIFAWDSITHFKKSLTYIEEIP